MNIHTANSKSAVTIDSVIEFEPWPFHEVEVELSESTGFWYGGNAYDKDSDANDGDCYKLIEDEDTVLVTFSNGRRVITQSCQIENLDRLVALVNL